VSPISEADLDRLADYTAGLLDQRERDRVDELIATDPQWRDAHAALLAAQPRLDTALAGLSAERLPVEVATQLDAALVREGQPADTRTPARARRGWRRLLVSTAAAAAALVAVFGGIVVLSNSGGPASSTNSGQGGGAALSAPSPAEGLADAAPATVLHTGTDYTPQNLSAALGAGQGRKDAATAPRPAAPNGAQNAPGGDGALARLDDPQALRGCLAAIVAQHGGTPSAVDYARFQGRPALIVVLATGDAHRIVVAGPACGIAGAAELYTTMA
jgi:hypothetical protein